MNVNVLNTDKGASMIKLLKNAMLSVYCIVLLLVRG